MPELALRPMTTADWPAVRSIYAAGIATGNATFQPEPPSWEDFDAGHLCAHRLVAVEEADGVLGWCAVSPTSSRAVYSGVVEHSVYVSPSAQGRGVGRELLHALLETTSAAGIWTVQGSVFPENTASLALHRSMGFRAVGRRERIARMDYGPYAGQWRDTILIEHRVRA
ncbi:GNAT family N-acetyltransferase [Brevibacterium sp. 50QC2O2]|uniref:GNAT family N-acetyltransferase n=1 Tax=Brevibacterium TaxID=1696 RepID=UPI00211C1C98|nr:MULTISPECIES: GNAT family N-acetyltransferase [unclassified Brevibacterium]MCQ9368204.1 GNAT family N-acetyltransferase [Brevibacterium sp. 91QC2O2]MCQ9385543.1 GNAT family N-acetyltransferase [Brevibacterium sp. 68QC2CO]MCQ9389906.1 GNAT family N-acetyltransferase [Brevibacterium sp. 50QC2O2]